MLLSVAASSAVDPAAISLEPAAASLIPGTMSPARNLGWALRGSPEEATAALYEGAACRQAIAKANRTAWENLSCCHVSKAVKIWLSQRRSRWTRALYVRNQKAASTFLVQNVRELFEARRSRGLSDGEEPPDSDRDDVFKSKHRVPRGHAAGESTLVHTAVRDPITVAVDGYLEIARRTPSGVPWRDPEEAADYQRYAAVAYKQVKLLRGKGAGTSRQQQAENRSRFAEYEDRFNLKWRGQTCDSPRDALEKFASYLDALEAHSPMGQGFHVFPQALKIDFVLRAPAYNAIAKVEDLKDGMERIAAAAGVRKPSLPAASRRLKHTTRDLSCAQFDLVNSRDPLAVRVLMRLCKIYEADYTCFGYELPEVCRDDKAYVLDRLNARDVRKGMGDDVSGIDDR